MHDHGAGDLADAELKRDWVYEQILLDIICRELRPGERIDEVALADRYAAGRAGVRDALYRLSLEGLVDRRARLGTVVSNTSVVELEQVFQLRVQLEGQCAALAARHARSQDLAAIRAAFVDVDRIIAEGDWRSLVQRDRAFHGAVAAAAHNAWLARTIVTLHNSALRFWHYALPRRPMDALQHEIACHLAVAAAIEQRNPQAAQTAMRAVLGEFPGTVQGLFSGVLDAYR